MARWFNRFLVFVVGLMPRALVYPFARRYIAGPSLQDAIAATKDLNEHGLMATLDVLGEGVTRAEDARKAVRAYLETLHAIVEHGLDANISLKPTQFGMAFDEALAERNIREVVAEAHRLGVFVRIDMEDSPFTSATLALYRRLREDYPGVGTVIQSRLRRALEDVEALPSDANLRLVKGIYLEPFPVAFQSGEVINRNYVLLLETIVARGGYVGIATHDDVLVWEACRLLRQYDVPRERHEFQVLLGVREDLRDILLKDGQRVRVYVPFGEEWHAYAMRRLKENPDIAGYVLQSLFLRDRGATSPSRHS